MTLWNPLNVFSGRTPSAAEPCASFDPSRIGDPVAPRPADPAIGVGGTQTGGPASAGDPRRHPIGFAPPADQEAGPRFRTEISFKRHHELPRAGVTPSSPGDGPQHSWQSAEPVVGSADSAGDDAERSDAVQVDAGQIEIEQVSAESVVLDADEAPAEKSVPFLKREISFRRKKPEAAEAVGANEIADEGANEVEQTVDEPVLLGETAEIVEPEAPVVAEEDELVAEPATAAVPFYKREISFRRQKPLAADETYVGEGTAALEPVMAHEADRVETDTGTSDALPSSEPHPIAEPVAAAVAVGYASGDAVADHVRPEDDAAPDPGTGEAPVEELAPLPVAVAIASETATEVDAAPAHEDISEAEVPSTGGRFGSRRPKSEKSSAKRQGKGRRVVGLKIGASQLAAAIMTETERGHELVGLARRPLAAGIVVDGEVRDETALAAAVRSFFDEEKLPKTDVRVGLSSNRIGVRTLDIDVGEDESRFDNAVRFKAHEVLPVALSESVLDYRVLEERVGEDGAKSRRVLLVVAPRDQVEPYTRVAALAGIRLESVDLEALGLLRAFVEPRTGASTPDDTASVVVSIGHESSTLLVAGAGACEFTRVFDWGGGALEDAITAALDVRPAEAATILRHLSLSGPGRQYELLDEATRAKATDAVRQRLTPFARELVNSLQFYQTQAESLGIGGIQITGGTSHLEGIEEALHQMIGVGVSVGDPLARVIPERDFDPGIEAAIGSLAVPIGLAIDDGSMRGVNLMPKETVVRKSRRSLLTTVGAPVAVAVPIAALAFLYLGAHSKVSDNQTELDAVKAELAALPEPTVPVIDNAVAGNEAIRATAVANVLGGRVAWEAVFRDMSRVLPGNVWLSTLSLTSPDATNLAAGAVSAPLAAAPGVQPVPTAVSIDGFTFTQPDVARLLARLATLPSLKRVTLTSSAGELLGSKKVVRFKIVADLNENGGAS